MPESGDAIERPHASSTELPDRPHVSSTELRQAQECLAVAIEAGYVLEPTHNAGRRQRMEVADGTIRAMVTYPGAAEAFLVPLSRAAIFEDDPEVRGNVIKALGVLREIGSPGIIEGALYEAAKSEIPGRETFQPRQVLQLLEAEARRSADSADSAVGEVDELLYGEGYFYLREVDRAGFLEVRLQALTKNPHFKEYEKTNRERSKETKNRRLAGWAQEFEWLQRHESSVLPKGWTRPGAIIKDLERTREFRIPTVLIDAALDHPKAHVALAAAKHHPLNASQQARLVARGDVKLRPDPVTFFRRHGMDLHLSRRRRALGDRRQKTEE